MKKIVYSVVVLLEIVFLTACGKNSFIGTYKLVEISNATESYSKKMIEELGLNYELIIVDEKKATLKMMGENLDLTYDDKKFLGVNKETNEEESIPYTKENNQIKISIGDEKMVFEK